MTGSVVTIVSVAIGVNSSPRVTALRPHRAASYHPDRRPASCHDERSEASRRKKAHVR
jgi:hypothetical protein